MNQYVIQDRVTATKYALTVSDSRFLWTASSESASAEPIVRDLINTSNYFKLFISDGRFAIESTATEQDDSILLADPVSGLSYSLAVSNGRFGIVATATGEFHNIFFTINSVVDYISQEVVVSDNMAQVISASDLLEQKLGVS